MHDCSCLVSFADLSLQIPCLKSISYDLKFSILLGSFSAILCINFLTKERKYSLPLFFPIECCASLAPHCYTHTRTRMYVSVQPWIENEGLAVIISFWMNSHDYFSYL